MGDIKTADIKPKRILSAIEQAGPGALTELGIETQDVIGALESIFPKAPEHAIKARQILEGVPTPEKAEVPVKGKVEPSKADLAALGFATDEELGIAEEAEEVTAEVTVPAYSKMKKAELQAELGRRPDQKVAKSWTKKVLIDKLEALDEEVAIEPGEAGILPEGQLEFRTEAEIEAAKAPVEEAPAEVVGVSEGSFNALTDQLKIAGISEKEQDHFQRQYDQNIDNPAVQIQAYHGLIELADKKGKGEAVKEAITLEPEYEAFDALTNKQKQNFNNLSPEEQLALIQSKMIIPEAPAEKKAEPGITDEDLETNFQRIAEGRMPLVKDKPLEAKIIRDDVTSKYPAVKLVMEKIVTDEAGIEVAGKALGAVASWSAGKATWDTAPHEVLHTLTEALESDPVAGPILKRAYKEMGGKEEFHQYAGEYYATNTLKGQPKGRIANLKTALRKFWVRVKKLLGKPAEYVAEQYFEKGKMFEGADVRAVEISKELKKKRQILINEASMEIEQLRRQHGRDILKRHPKDPDRIGTVFVPKDKRGRKIGTKLFEAIKKEFIGKGKNRIIIEATPYERIIEDAGKRETVPSPIPFWEKMGFKKIGEEKKYGEWVHVMEYTIPAEDMVIEQPLYQRINENNEAGRAALRMLDNAFNAMIAETGKKIPIGEYLHRLGSLIPEEFAGIFDYWRSVHNKLVRKTDLITDTLAGTAINDAYADAGEFDKAFDRIATELDAGLDMIEPNDASIMARNSENVPYGFMRTLGIDMPQKKINDLLNEATIINREDITPEEAFNRWANDALYKYTGFKYDDFPSNAAGILKQRRIKQLYVYALSRIRVNTKSLAARHVNFEYNSSANAMVVKGNQNAWSEETNNTRATHMIYEATEADKDWNEKHGDEGSPIAWLQESDLIRKAQYGRQVVWFQHSQALTNKNIKNIAQSALNIRSEADNIHGHAMLGIRGDAGHFMFAPIRQRHLDIASDSARLIAHWKDLVDNGTISKEQARNLLGFRLQEDGTWKKTNNASQVRWLAAEVTRIERMLDIMPASMINNGTEFMRRVKIMSTPVFTSPLMNDFKAVIIASGAEKDNIVFEDRNGNRANMVEFMAGMGLKNRTDGASIGSKSLFDNYWNAFGANNERKVIKNVIWNKLLKLAVKHETFMPESGMKIYSEPEGSPALLIAEVDNEGNIFTIDGEKRTPVDLLMTDDEAKYSSFKSGEVIDIAGNEFGLIKYHESASKNAKFPHQWLNYVQDTEVLNAIRNNILPRVQSGLNRLFTLTNSSSTMPSLIHKFMKALRSDSPHAITTALVEKAKLGLGLHSDASGMLNKLFKTRLVDDALQLANGRGTYVDLAPDYFGTHKPDDVSLAVADANEIFKAYVAKEGGDIKDAKQMGIRRINQWLEDNPQRALISRSPIPFIGGVFVGNVKALHERGGQIVISSETAIKRLEADNDGDALQVEFLPDNFLDCIATALSDADTENRIKAINLDALKEDQTAINDMSKVENVYSLSEKFSQGARAIGEIANVQNIYGQLSIGFNHIKTAEGYIRLKDITQTRINFNEAGKKDITMEEELRMWLQAAVDNGKYLLLDKWNYSQDKLFRRIFAMTEADGTYIREITDAEWTLLVPMVMKHKIPGRIRNGRKPDQAYTLETIQQESQDYKTYTDNRENYIREKLPKNAIEIEEMSFNNEIAPLEEIAIQLASMWDGNERTGQVAQREPGKETPVKFADEIYNAVHFKTMRVMEETKYQDLKDAIAREEEIYGELSEADINQRAKNGHAYAIQMWTSKGEEDGTGIGFVALLEGFQADIGPQSWDHNPDMLRFTEYWSDIFTDMTPVEQEVATHVFLEGFYQYSKQQDKVKGKVVKTMNRNVLPPISDNPMLTVLNAEVMAKYFASYNSILSNIEERMTSTGALTNYERYSQLIKKACR